MSVTDLTKSIKLSLERGAYNRKNAAYYLDISVRLLDDLAAAGTIKRIKIGRKSLFRKVDLDAFLDELAEEESQ